MAIGLGANGWQGITVWKRLDEEVRIPQRLAFDGLRAVRIPVRIAAFIPDFAEIIVGWLFGKGHRPSQAVVIIAVCVDDDLSCFAEPFWYRYAGHFGPFQTV